MKSYIYLLFGLLTARSCHSSGDKTIYVTFAINYTQPFTHEFKMNTDEKTVKEVKSKVAEKLIMLSVGPWSTNGEYMEPRRMFNSYFNHNENSILIDATHPAYYSSRIEGNAHDLILIQTKSGKSISMRAETGSYTIKDVGNRLSSVSNSGPITFYYDGQKLSGDTALSKIHPGHSLQADTALTQPVIGASSYDMSEGSVRIDGYFHNGQIHYEWLQDVNKFINPTLIKLYWLVSTSGDLAHQAMYMFNYSPYTPTEDYETQILQTMGLSPETQIESSLPNGTILSKRNPPPFPLRDLIHVNIRSDVAVDIQGTPVPSTWTKLNLGIVDSGVSGDNPSDYNPQFAAPASKRVLLTLDRSTSNDDSGDAKHRNYLEWRMSQINDWMEEIKDECALMKQQISRDPENADVLMEKMKEMANFAVGMTTISSEMMLLNKEEGGILGGDGGGILGGLFGRK